MINSSTLGFWLSNYLNQTHLRADTKRIVLKSGLFVLLVLSLCSNCLAVCEGDLDRDGKVDDFDLTAFAACFGRNNYCEDELSICARGFHSDCDVDGSDLAEFADVFGRTDCPVPAPLNLFNIGNSIGEAEAAYDNIGWTNHQTVWSTGYDDGDIVYSLNERFEQVDSNGYYENDTTRDSTFNHSVSGSIMADFVTQANEIVTAAGETPSGKVGMVTIFLGNNDVCATTLEDMTAPELFELQYRNGLDALALSDATKNAYIHVSSIPAIYWLWNAKQTDPWCKFVWSFVPCENLLSNPADDCANEDSRFDPDNIHDDDGPDCRRRKQFHADIRDVYNPILRDVLMEYKGLGLLPNAYFVDVFDLRFESIDVNGGDCFHPSIEGHAMLAEEQWRRSPWSIEAPF